MEMNYGGPVWHASAAMAGDPRKAKLRKLAEAALAGAGDPRLGEWHEWTGRAYHLRRRLTEREQALVGPVVDCRGTGEFFLRLGSAMDHIPAAAVAMAYEENRR
jgi:hypothetical protein